MASNYRITRTRAGSTSHHGYHSLSQYAGPVPHRQPAPAPQPIDTRGPVDYQGVRAFVEGLQDAAEDRKRDARRVMERAWLIAGAVRSYQVIRDYQRRK